MSATSLRNDLQVSTTNKQILKIALPITLALLVPQINFIANTIFLSGLGEMELGVAGITGVYYLVFALVGNGFNSGLQALIARRAGENRPAEIGKLYFQSLWITLFSALLGIAVTYIFCHSFFAAALNNPVVEATATDFLKIRIWGLPFLYFFQMSNAMLVGSNNSHLMKYGFISEALINIFLDYCLIYGRLGFPNLGFNGAAYASVIAEVTGFFIVLVIILVKKMHHRFSLFAYKKYNSAIAGLFFKQSSPLVMQYLLSVCAWLLFYILIEHKGERPLAISNTMRNIFGMFGIFVWAFASTSNAMVSNIIGQKRNNDVLPLINKIMWLSMGFTLFMCLLINIFPETFFSIYGRDAGFTQESIPVLRIVSSALLLMSVATVWLNGVTGTGNTRINLLIEIIAITAYAIYIYLVLHVWNLSLVWAWSSEFLYWAILFTLSFIYLKSDKWKGKVI